MKNLKQNRIQLAYFLTFIFMVPMFYSCTNDTMLYVEKTNVYEDKAKSMVSAIDVFKAHQETTSRNIGNEEITQDTVDQYAVLLGFDAGDFSLETIETVIEKQAEGKTYTQLMDEYNLTSFTKLTLQSIKNGNWIEDLENNAQYQNLNNNEKEVIALSNAFLKALQDNNRDHTLPEATGALVGLLIGGACCGVVGAIAGTILGAVIGSACN